MQHFISKRRKNIRRIYANLGMEDRKEHKLTHRRNWNQLNFLFRHKIFFLFLSFRSFRLVSQINFLIQFCGCQCYMEPGFVERDMCFINRIYLWNFRQNFHPANENGGLQNIHFLLILCNGSTAEPKRLYRILCVFQSRLIDRDELHLLNFLHTQIVRWFFFKQATIRVVKIARERIYEALANMLLVTIDNWVGRFRMIQHLTFPASMFAVQLNDKITWEFSVEKVSEIYESIFYFSYCLIRIICWESQRALLGMFMIHFFKRNIM